jgi:O-antigen ligase
MDNQEILLLCFLATIWLSIPLGFGFNELDSNVEKMTKLTLIILISTHVITDRAKYEIFIIFIILTNLYLGYTVSTSSGAVFVDGRYDSGIGGTDFNEGNFLATHFAAFLPFAGLLFLSKDLKWKVVLLISGVLSVNAMIMVRSRGSLIALLVGGIAAILLSPKTLRSKMLAGLLIAGIGAFSLTDAFFWERMSNITDETEEMDSSSKGRLEAWSAAIAMFNDNPLGIGEGNFKRYVGQYNPDIPGKDTHNLYLRCLSELGIQGLFILTLLIANSFMTLRKIEKESIGSPVESFFQLHTFALRVSLIIYLIASFFLTTLYIEEFYWLLLMPVLLRRCLENSEEDSGNQSQGKDIEIADSNFRSL